MISKNLIIFDWDQTLWNGWDIHIHSLWYAADMLGLSRPRPEVAAQSYSAPFLDHLGSLLPHEPAAVMSLYLQFYKERVSELGHLYQGIAETVTDLKVKGYSLALFSDKRTVYGRSEAELTGIDQAFDAMLFREDGRAYKPDPQGLYQVLERLSARPQEALVVGDSHVDMECARRAGVASAAALWGSVNPQATLDQGPHYVWRTVADMDTAFGH